MMNSLFVLLASVLQAMEPASSGMALAGSAAILNQALGGLADTKIAEIDAALCRCAEGDSAGIDQFIKAVSPVSRPDIGGKINAATEALEGLFALRTAIRSGGALRAQARLAQPLSFVFLRSLHLPPADPGQPGMVLVGTLGDAAALTAPPPQGQHRLLRYITVAYDSAEAGPLLSIASLNSNGAKVPPVPDRRNWRQRPDVTDDLQTWLRDSRILIATRPITGPVTITSPGVQIDVAQPESIRLYETTLHDERKRLLFTYIRAFPMT